MTMLTVQELERWLVVRLAELRGLDPRDIDVRERFSRYGLDSLGATRLVGALATHLGKPLSPTLVWECPTIEALAKHVAGAAEPETAVAIETSSEPDEPIAIVGMACRLPGAPDPASFWSLLCEGRHAIGEVAPERGWDELLLARGVEPEERARVRRGGFLERIDGFDPLFFGVSPREASAMDPQQRLLLELCWEALEDAGIPPSTLKGSPTGIFAGAIWSDYGPLLYRQGAEGLGQYTITGYHHSILANRLSYVLGAEGPSFTLDSACSSGLTVVHLGCESLRRGESSLVIAATVNLNVLPESALGVARFGALSADGRCYTFDSRANGYVRGEGGGVLLMKTLSRAIKDGDRVYCVVRGSAINNDGASNGLTAPSRNAQEAVLAAAYRRAGVPRTAVQYVEAHGTGTPLGDPIEARALGAVLGAGRAAGAALRVGSAKTNVGHLEGAAGIVGLTKVALAIQNRLLPPSLNFETPNPHAPLRELGLEVQTTLGPWPAPDERLVAGVSSFGLGGSNAHVVVEEWPAPRTEALALGEHDPAALRQAVAALRDALADGSERAPLAEICARAARGVRRVAPQRLGVVARSKASLERALTSFLEGRSTPAVHARPSEPIDVSKGVVFVFPGQGAQWFGMARSLLQGEPVFRAALLACDRLARPHLGSSLVDELTASRASSRLDRIEVSLPAIISIGIATAALWRSLGVEPAAVVGHSTGEIAAAHVAGVLDLDDTMRIICAYGRVIGRTAGRGGMALVGLPWDEAESVLRGFEGRVFRAIQDSAASTVLAGEPAAIAHLLEELRGRGLFCRPVAMDVAPHSPLADALRDELFEALRPVRPRASDVPLFSEVTGAEMRGEDLDAAHWVRNFGDPAYFSRAVDALIERGHRVFLDVGPHPITKHSVETNLKRAGVRGAVLASLRRDEEERAVVLDTLAQLHALGYDVRWSEVYPDGESDHEPLLLPLSARSVPALRDLAARYADVLAPSGGALRDASVHDVVVAASVRRDHHAHRLAVVGTTRAELAARLADFARQGAADGVFVGDATAHAKTVFVFPGQGSQWLGMARGLSTAERAFRRALAQCDEVIRSEAGFSVLDELAASEEHSRLAHIDVVQPVLFAIEVALAALWRAWGVIPDAVIGHSMGEVAAAHVAGALELADAAAVICRRSKLLKRMSGKGAMGLVELTVPEAERAIAAHADRLGVAVSNGPRSTVISGDPGALEEVLASLEARGVFCRRVKVDVASHSPQMDALRDELLAALSDVRPRDVTIPMRSTVTGELVRGSELGARYWVDNLRAPVLFSTATQRLLEGGHTLFVEQSPHPILLPAVEENVRDAKREGAVIASLRRNVDEPRAMREALGALYARGGAVRWDHLRERGARFVRLPSYPWQRERFWVETAAPPLPRARGEHPLLGAPFAPSLRPRERFWQQTIRADDPGYLGDHRVQDQVVFPGAAYVEMALAAVARASGAHELQLEGIRFEQMLVLPMGSEHQVQTALTEEAGGRASVEIASRSGADAAWARHASARAAASTGEKPPAAEPIERARERCRASMTGGEHYAAMERRDLHYGARFRGVERIWLGEREVVAEVQLPDDLAAESAAYVIHPALLDACLQVIVAVPSARAGEHTVVPVAIDSLRLTRGPMRRVLVHARAVDDAYDLTLANEEGELVATIRGVRVIELAADGRPTRGSTLEHAYTVVWREQALVAAPEPGSGAWLVVTDGQGTGTALAAALRARGVACVEAEPSDGRFERSTPMRYRFDPTRPEHVERVLGEAFDRAAPCRGVVHCGALLATPLPHTTSESLAADLRLGTLAAVRLAQGILRRATREVPRLVLVTRDAQGPQASPAAAQAPLWGLARTVAIEHPELECTCIDIPAQPGPDDGERVARELLASDGEQQVVLREGARFVARLAHASAEDTVDERREPARGRAFRVAISAPGALDGIGLRELARRSPGPGEVEIEVEAAGLNFLDVLLALGLLPDEGASEPRLGGECAGRVTRVGAGVDDLRIGDEVMAAVMPAMATHVIARRELVARRPSRTSWEEAATIPIAFLTAYYALEHVARLRRGERVLVHAGAGGVGMAAIQWAQHVGAEVIATAGSEAKRELLRSLGVAHVLDSRALSFAEGVRRATNGEGVDVVLNSLSGEFIPASLGVLREQGRFIEIGKRDYHEDKPLGLRPFLRGLTFSLVDLRGLMQKRPELVARLLAEIGGHFDSGALRPLPCAAVPASRAADAFSRMAQAQHTGKLAILMRDPDARIAPLSSARSEVRADATYLITGGLGGLGLRLARGLVERGARHLALVGRSAPNADARAAIRAMEEAGAEVRALPADVARESDVARVLDELRGMPPLRGVVHAAAVLDDRTVLELDEEPFWAPLRPKVLGAWNLHAATRALPLDFFVLYSSVAALVGSPGQAAYGAGNAFLDALAHARAAAGLPAISIQWGPFAEVGLAAAQANRGQRLSSQGFESFSPDEGVALFFDLLAKPRVEIGLVRFSARQWIEAHPQVAGIPYFAEVARAADRPATGGRGTLRASLEQAPAPQRASLIQAHVREQLGRVLRLDPSRIDPRTPFTSLGVDSLTSLELRNRLEATLGLKLSATLLFTYATPAALAAHLRDLLFPDAVAELPPPATAPRAADDLNQLDEDALLAALDAELSRTRKAEEAT
jgi:acyl transferase domain-containing protein/acyl carrier protein